MNNGCSELTLLTHTMISLFIFTSALDETPFFWLPDGFPLSLLHIFGTTPYTSNTQSSSLNHKSLPCKWKIITISSLVPLG